MFEWTLMKRLIWIKAAVISGAASLYETVTGAIVSFVALHAKALKKLVVNIAPVQDLHGYAAPWPPGGGVNKFDESTVTFRKWTNASGQVEDALYGCISAAVPVHSSTYYVSFFGSGINSYSIVEYASDDSFIARQHVAGGYGSQFTLNASTAYIKLQVSCPTTDTITAEILASYKAVLSEGSTAPATWSPYSNECPISGWTGAEVTAAGQNLFDPDHPELLTLDYQSPAITRWGHLYNKPGKYAIKAYGSGLSSYIYARKRNADGTWDGESYLIVGTSTTPYIMTLTEGQTFVVYNVQNQTEEVSIEKFTSWDIQVAYSETQPDAFATYQGITEQISWQDEAGTVYSGTATVKEDGSVDLVATMAEVDMGARTWASGFGGFYLWGSSLGPKIVASTIVPNMLCSIYKTVDYANLADKTISMVYGGAEYPYNGNIVVKDSNYTSAAAFQAGMSGQKFVYELAQPVTYHLDSITQLSTIVGTNNIWANTGDVEVTYYAA